MTKVATERRFRSYFLDKHDAAITTACQVLEEEIKKRK